MGDKDGTLSVQPAIDAIPGPVHVRAQRRRPRRLPVREYVDGILGGDRTILGRAITLIESVRPDDISVAQDILEACLPKTGNSVRVGITGAPGVGKSSFIEALGTHLIEGRDENVAVLAVDPTSRLSHGSILGDKTRMSRLANEPRAFIRPSPSGGSLGGVARRTREAMLVCEAAGYRNVLVETVGVGQSETVVRAMVDFFLLLAAPGAGDELQGMKRGIMETTDLIAINKADGDNRIRAEVARREYENALHLFPETESGWAPRVLTCSAHTGEGVAGIWDTVLEHHAMLENRGLLETIRRGQIIDWLHDMIQLELATRFRSHPRVRAALPEVERAITEGRLSSFRAVEQLLKLYEEAD